MLRKIIDTLYLMFWFRYKWYANKLAPVVYTRKCNNKREGEVVREQLIREFWNYRYVNKFKLETGKKRRVSLSSLRGQRWIKKK